MSTRAWMEVSLSGLTANARTVRAASRGARLLPMVKADGYGLGAVRVAAALERAVDPWGFGVAAVEEGAALREAGVSRPIVVFTPARTDQQALYQALDLRAVLDHPAAIEAWKLPFHLEIDTGMGRCGMRWDDDRLSRCRSSGLEGAFFHFHSAEDNPASVARQWERFQAALDRLGERPPLLHAANSAGVWHFEVALDLVRPGIYLYGCSPAPGIPEPRPVATVRARVVSLRRIGRGDSVSYGAEWVAPRDSVVATVAFGYADGLPRMAQGSARVLCHGRSFPVVGRITMDLVMADVTGQPDAVSIGDTVTLVGIDDRERITWEEVAGWGRTNTYEMMSRIGRRVERVYVD